MPETIATARIAAKLDRLMTHPSTVRYHSVIPGRRTNG
jgi:hypothetical protein